MLKICSFHSLLFNTRLGCFLLHHGLSYDRGFDAKLFYISSKKRRVRTTSPKSKTQPLFNSLIVCLQATVAHREGPLILLISMSCFQNESIPKTWVQLYILVSISIILCQEL